MIINCPECGKKTAMLNDTCEHCGIKLKKCPECENVMEYSQTTCDYCGYTFEVKEEKVVVNEVMQKDDNFEELRKKTIKLSTFAQSENKKYRKIGGILEGVSFAILIVVIVIGLLYTNSSRVLTLSKARTIISVCKVVLILDVLVNILSNVIKEFRTIFSVSAINRKIKSMKFDYKTYYKSPAAVKKIDGGSDWKSWGELELSWGEAELINAIRYKEDPSKKTPVILSALVDIICWTVIAICAYIFMSNMIEQTVLGALFGVGGFKFKFTTELIVAIVFLVIDIVVGLFLDNENKKAIEWAEKQQKNA